MGPRSLITMVATAAITTGAVAAGNPAMDTFRTSAGDLQITFVGHGTLMFAWAGKVVHVDPWSQLADYATMPKADLILVTHEHRDHLDAKAVQALSREGTQVLANAAAAAALPGSATMENGDVAAWHGIKVEAVPAYNLVHKREGGQPFHPRGSGNGYVLTFGDTRVYVTGDSENTPEMKALRGLACAFLPMNLPYTMTPEMVADAARAMEPKVLYPYHFGDTDTARLGPLLEGTGIEVRIRNLK
jgi:L-ascorbate metabolism protein UlaG (beta-lactamase superfamily)